jgi:hypothetical protein
MQMSFISRFMLRMISTLIDPLRGLLRSWNSSPISAVGMGGEDGASSSALLADWLISSHDSQS